MEAESIQIHVRLHGEHIRGSPLHATVLDPLGLAQVFIINARASESHQLLGRTT